jgi:hypothetical protein
MSNRNFDFSAIVKILNAQNNANFYNRQQTVVQRTPGIPYTIELQPGNPQTGNYDADTIATLQAGQQAYYFKGVPDTTVLSPQIYTPTITTPSSTPYAPPSAPVITGITAGNGAVSVTFTQAAATPSITNYQYVINSGSVYTEFNPAVTNSPVLVPGTNGDPMTVTLQAISSAGASVDSNISSSATPNGSLSEIPVLDSATPGNGSADIVVTWTSSIQLDSKFQYSINNGTYADVPGGSPAGADPSYTITGLTNGVPVTIRFKYVFDSAESIPSNALTVTPSAESSASSVLPVTSSG